jgi:hypothetical protein
MKAAILSSSARLKGRPPLKAGEAKRASFNTRLRTALREQLQEFARAAGRSLSEEIEFRLERSCEEDLILRDEDARLRREEKKKKAAALILPPEGSS